MNLSPIIICLLLYITTQFKGFGKTTNTIIILVSSFYILQDLIWSKNPYIIKWIKSIQNNELRIIVCFTILATITIAVNYLYQKPISKALQKNSYTINKRRYPLCVNILEQMESEELQTQI